MKQILISGALSLLAILCFPGSVPAGQAAPEPQDIVVWTQMAPAEAPEPAETEHTYEEAQPQTVRLLDGGTVITLDMTDYLTAVVLCEMPPEFEPEALKAQAVAARTFTVKRAQSSKHENADVCSDSACCQAWKSEAALREKFASDYDACTRKARDAVEATDGEVLVYDGALIDAVYFSCSGGRTEDAVAVWGADVPYLRSVESYGEEAALRYSSEVSFTPAELRSLLGDETLAGAPEGWFGAVCYTHGGGVDTMQIGKKSYPGTELRRLLGLNSTVFTVSVDFNTIVFHVLGYGHRVGMSQYGANHMAQQGFDYRVILQYYYQGAEVQKIAASGNP